MSENTFKYFEPKKCSVVLPMILRKEFEFSETFYNWFDAKFVPFKKFAEHLSNDEFFAERAKSALAAFCAVAERIDIFNSANNKSSWSSEKRKKLRNNTLYLIALTQIFKQNIFPFTPVVCAAIYENQKFGVYFVYLLQALIKFIKNVGIRIPDSVVMTYYYLFSSLQENKPVNIQVIAGLLNIYSKLVGLELRAGSDNTYFINKLSNIEWFGPHIISGGNNEELLAKQKVIVSALFSILLRIILALFDEEAKKQFYDFAQCSAENLLAKFITVKKLSLLSCRSNNEKTLNDIFDWQVEFYDSDEDEFLVFSENNSLSDISRSGNSPEDTNDDEEEENQSRVFYDVTVDGHVTVSFEARVNVSAKLAAHFYFRELEASSPDFDTISTAIYDAIYWNLNNYSARSLINNGDLQFSGGPQTCRDLCDAFESSMVDLLEDHLYDQIEKNIPSDDIINLKFDVCVYSDDCNFTVNISDFDTAEAAASLADE